MIRVSHGQPMAAVLLPRINDFSMERRRAELEQLDVHPPRRGRDGDARARARAERGGSHLDTALPQLLNSRIKMLDLEAEMRASDRTRRGRLHHLHKRVAVDLKVRQVRRPVRLLKRKRLPKAHLRAVEIEGAFVVGHADRDVIESHDAPLLREGVGSMIRQLRSRFRFSLISGDNPRHRCTMSALLGTDSELLFGKKPADKLS